MLRLIPVSCEETPIFPVSSEISKDTRPFHSIVFQLHLFPRSLILASHIWAMPSERLLAQTSIVMPEIVKDIAVPFICVYQACHPSSEQLNYFQCIFAAISCSFSLLKQYRIAFVCFSAPKQRTTAPDHTFQARSCRLGWINSPSGHPPSLPR